MNITKRITKFLLIAALAIPAWSTASAQDVANECQPPKGELKLRTQGSANLPAQVMTLKGQKTTEQKLDDSFSTIENSANQGSKRTTTPVSYRFMKKMAAPAGGGDPVVSGQKAPTRAGTPVTVPSSATIETWDLNTTWYYYNGTSESWVSDDYEPTTLRVAFDGNDIYIQGLCYSIPTAWVKGTISGTTATFATGQYFGMSGENEMWFVGYNFTSSSYVNVTFTYNATKHTLTQSNTSVGILCSTESATNVCYNYHRNVSLSKHVDKVVVSDESTTNQYVPVYGYWYDSQNTSQMIYPVSYLSDIPDGAIIKSITFHTNSSGITFGESTAGKLTATIGSTSYSSFSSASTLTIEGDSKTATAIPTYGETTLTFNFDDFVLNKSKHLIVQVVNTTTGTYSPSDNRTYWLGKAVSNISYNSKSGSRESFMPKMTIEYENSIKEYEATLTGNGEFGDIQKGETATATFTITNTGANPFTPVLTVSGDPVFTVADGASGQLAAGGTRDYTVTFAPTAVQEYSGTLTLSAQENEALEVSATAALSGTGVNEKSITVADGTDAGNVPVFLYALDYYNHGQIIYPADSLNLTSGSKIKSITFYANGNLTDASGNSSNNPVTIKLGETGNATYGSSTTFLTNVEQVSTRSNILTGSTSVTFTLSTPYEYQGGSLVVDATTNAYSSSYKYPAEGVKWIGKTVENSSLLFYSKSSSSSNTGDQKNFLPKMTMVVEMTEPTTTAELDFGPVNVGDTKTLHAYVANDSGSPVVANVTVSPNPPFSVANSTVTLAADGLTPIAVTFTPSAAYSYSGTLTVDINGTPTIIALKGAGNESGPEAVRDSSFFAGITYEWPINNPTKESALTEIATDPDQIIAMLREVYMNKDIPGNYVRGYNDNAPSSAQVGPNINVQYTGAGTITYDGSQYVDFDDTYGWKIPGNLDVDTYTYDGNTINYAYMDPDQYKPNYEGVTLLLLEMVDDFNPANVSVTSTGYQGLREYFSKTIKSARVITQAMRTGDGLNRGTLFNIACDKMNKFYLIAKGQLQWLRCAWYEHQSSALANFFTEPCYVLSSYYDLSEFIDNALEKYFFLGHMFEQFSPAMPNATATSSDLYKDLVEMTSFNVNHDCPNVPYVENGHHFMMYGSDSQVADCQDVRDMMFFVPDYRMRYHSDRGETSSSSTYNYFAFQDYFEYNPTYAPKMGLYVIQQDSVEAVTRAEDYFKLKLTWDSNMDEFLPSTQQEYQLYQVFTDEFGVSKWIPVYERNAQGLYKNATTGEWQTDTIGAKPVVLTVDPSNTKKTYSEVYELRENSGRMVTYAVRGQDTDHFLSLQMSNEESYFIPGKDPAEMALMSSATVYSRYEAQNENNCYSNKIQIKSSPRTIKTSYLTNGNTMTINRSYSKLDENNNTVVVTEPIATLTINTSGKYFTVSGSVLDSSVKNLFPKGYKDGKTAGYHANTLTNGNQIAYTTETVDGTEYMNFDIPLWDNFVANVSKNEHPGMYTYQLVFNTAEPFTGLNGSTNEAYSNIIPVFVYKTDSRINEPLTLAQVQADVDCNPDYEPGDVEFSAQVMLSSKSEILRYDAYRWNEGADRSIIKDGGDTDEDEEDALPNGIAGNQGTTYTVSMNAVGTADYYVGDEVPVTAIAPLNWATFVDYYPAKQTDGGAFTYAPVVELFTRGYVEGSTTEERGDYNTYGGPLKTTAVGKIELEIPDNLNTAGNPFMSTYKWLDGEDWCAYYKIPVKFKVLGIPEGYELYKIRAWRDVDTDILREELTSRQDRIASNYLFEELTYGDALGNDLTMSKDNLYKNVDGTVYSYELGRRAVENYDADSNIQGETHATFGALRLDTKDGQPSSIKSLEATIKVRAYFTKSSNPILNDPIFVIATPAGGQDIDCKNAVANLLPSADGTTYTGTVTIPAGENGNGYFIFTKQLGENWNSISNYLFGADNNGTMVVDDVPRWEKHLTYWSGDSKVFQIAPGTYKLTITDHVQSNALSAQYNYSAGYLVIEKATANAPARALNANDFDYYVADGEVEFNSNMFNQIITGVTDVTMNGNREVVSVSYVNTIGQVSSTPWKGVNMVVTRYTDGSTSTTKVMK